MADKCWWSSLEQPYQEICEKCGKVFEMTKLEKELGHTLCQRCRVEEVSGGKNKNKKRKAVQLQLELSLFARQEG